MINVHYISSVRDAWYHTACTLVLLYSYVISGGLRINTAALYHEATRTQLVACSISLVGVCAVQQQVGPVSVFDGCGFLAVLFALW